MKPSTFHPDALTELQQQAEYHEEHNIGLGQRFIAQVEAAVALATSMPSVGSPHRFDTRRVFPRDFPHSTIDIETPDSLVILAVAPFKRKPGYWRRRT